MTITLSPTHLPSCDVRSLLLCHHEAGHAVACLAAGISFTAVEVYSDDRPDRLCGQVVLSGGEVDPVRLVATLWAGKAAELEWSRHHLGRSRHCGGSTEDDERAAERLAGLGWGTARHLRQRARRIVSRRWRQVTAIAGALRDVDRLTADDVAALVDAL